MRSHRLLDATRSQMLVVDMQEKLLAKVANAGGIITACSAMLQISKLLELPLLATEQYPAGLGATVEPIKKLLDQTIPMEKVAFSCWADQRIRQALVDIGKEQVLIVGIESHVCIVQTALDLQEAGYQVFVCRDAIGSRDAQQHDWALDRLAQQGVILSSVESAVFELLHRAGTEKFKAALPIIKSL